MSKRKVQKMGILSQLPLAIKTGKYVVGLKKTLETIIKKEAKCVVVASNLPEYIRKKLDYYCALADNIPLQYYKGTNNELTTLTGMSHRTSVISITDQGESELVEVN